ncbi:MAG: tryptophan synthase subunit alpha [Armatimonadetes bacterium]|nr:tryptophan synthase subunit alpha [Armatimonadota bacterium]
MTLAQAFQKAADENRAALIVYVAAGDPDLEHTEAIVKTLAQSGADIVELGIPYSDPIADGPTIQEAGQRALAAGTTVQGVLDCARRVRAATDIPFVIMTCFNPVVQYGLERFARAAVECGVQGVLLSDLPVDESGDWNKIARSAGLDTVYLAAPTTEPERRRLICRSSTGFVYVISRPGTTGVRQDLPEGLPALLAELRQIATSPIAVGFGISTPAHVRAVAEMADGAIVGSAVVDVIGRHGKGPGLLPAISRLVEQLAAATARTPGTTADR